MPRDYARSRSRRDEEPRSGPSGFVWMLMGVLVGLMIAGVFYLKNQSKSRGIVLPQEKQEKQLSANKGEPGETTAPSSANAAPAPQKAQTPKTQNLQTQFDFYSVLPGKKTIGPSGDEDTSEIQQQDNRMNGNTAPAATPPSPPAQASQSQQALPPPVEAAPPQTEAAKPAPANKLPLPLTSGKVVSSATPKAKAPSGYIVQVATFSEHSDADQQKAQLALLGFEAKVSEIQKGGKTLERVWLGPFSSKDTAEALQKQLQDNSISSKVLKSGS